MGWFWQRDHPISVQAAHLGTGVPGALNQSLATSEAPY